jgi:mRNA interferase RelE/StbE
MRTGVIYTKKAKKDLKKLDKKDSFNIASKIEFYSKQKNPLKYAKKLKLPLDDLYRFKVGDYRVVFETDSKGKIFLLIILKVGHRKDIY